MKNGLKLLGCLIAGIYFAPSILLAQAPALETKSTDSLFANFSPLKAPAVNGLLLHKGDRLAICGDSITEQHTYSRILETYLTVCAPQLKVSVRQFGWSGETAEGFLNRMTNDCLRFKPTIATTCYGMNDHRYRPYDETNAQWYRKNSASIVQAFKATGARVIIGSPGCIGKMPPWVKTASGTVEDLNLNLCAFRNLDIEIAAQENVRFADVFWPMFTAGAEARKKFGNDYAICGKDGVHPGMAGAVVMATAFLKSMGFDGDLGTFSVDLQQNAASATQGHKVNRLENGVLTLTSHRYPYCAADDPSQDGAVRSGMSLIGFNKDLNRLMLVVKGTSAPRYKITWGPQSRTYSADQLNRGVNLADDFTTNPFSESFARVEAAILVKQKYETRQVQTLFHGDEGHLDMEATVAFTEKNRQKLVDSIAPAFVPVTHSLKIEAQE